MKRIRPVKHGKKCPVTLFDEAGLVGEDIGTSVVCNCKRPLPALRRGRKGSK